MKSLSNQGARKRFLHGNVVYLWGKNSVNLSGVGFLGHHIKISTCADEVVENCISATGKG